MTPLLVATVGAGAIGALLRYGATVLADRSAIPWAVLAVNAVGSFVAGIAIHSGAAEVVVTGFAGGLTTFSTWSVETVQLAIEERWRVAALNVAANLSLGILAAVVGWLLGAAIFG